MNVVRAYRGWRDLGAGGLPHNPVGWSIATALRPLGRDTVDLDRHVTEIADAPPVETLRLDARSGPRPRLAPEPVPHRQTTQTPSADDDPTPQDALTALAALVGPSVEIRRSHFERHGDALVAPRPDPRATWLIAALGEAAHRHASDGSWHVVLHPSDAVAVIACGWGERHPLAGVPLLGLPSTYLIVYAPRDPDEWSVVQRIVRAALAWAG